MEKIYTIPVNEAFDKCAEEQDDCPFCRLYKQVEANEVDLILGASMMEPDTRIKTNEMGFCSRHYPQMLKKKNRLGLALMLESHLDQVKKDAKGFGSAKKLAKMTDSCYVCSRIEYHIERMLETAVWLYENDPAFEKKLAAQKFFCIPHYNRFLEAGKSSMKRSKFSEFEKKVANVNFAYMEELRHDVSWFCNKFDYRYDAEPWGNSKDSPERAIKFLCGTNTLDEQ